MSDNNLLMIFLSVSVAFIHTLIGPDHYIPFIALSKGRKWSPLKTAWVTVFCGSGHVLSSILLGSTGLFLGIGIHHINKINNYRGNLAGWLFLSFGVVYFIHGIQSVMKKKRHTHVHYHEDGTAHSHDHNHFNDHSHFHENEKKKTMTVWVLFLIFVFGPCEPLVPLIMVPSSTGSFITVLLMVLSFFATTIVTMLAIVLGSLYGLKRFEFCFFEKYGTAVTGVLIFACGFAINFLGL